MLKFFTKSAFLFILLLCLSNARNPGYDSLQLVLHWPVSFCNDIRNPHRCGKIPFNYFKIHGLRHCYTQTGRCKVYCGDDGVRLEEYQLPRHLQLKLNREWPDLKIGHSNLNFWRYQWKKHGYCSGKSAQAYFEQAINLSKKYAKLVDILRKYGECSPGEIPSCELTKIKNSIEEIIGRTPQFLCNQGRGRVTQLFEITFCFDKFGRSKHCIFSAKGCNQDYLILLPSIRTLWHDEFRRGRHDEL